MFTKYFADMAGSINSVVLIYSSKLNIRNIKRSIKSPLCCFKWNLNDTLKSWEGLLVKVQFQCESSTATTKEITSEHCVVIKYTGTFTGIL